LSKEWLTYLIASYINEKFSGLIIMESNKTRLDKDDNLIIDYGQVKDT